MLLSFLVEFLHISVFLDFFYTLRSLSWVPLEHFRQQNLELDVESALQILTFDLRMGSEEDLWKAFLKAPVKRI